MKNKRLHLIYGNHDMVYKNPEYVKKHLLTYFDPKEEKEAILFEQLNFHEAIILKHTGTGQEIFLTHGASGRFYELPRLALSAFYGKGTLETITSVGYCRPYQSCEKQQGTD